MEISEKLMQAALADAFARLLSDGEFSDRLADRVADRIADRFELLSPSEAAALLEVTPRTIADNHVDWGLDKSLAFGASNPRYFLSQVIERARARVIKGRRLKAA